MNTGSEPVRLYFKERTEPMFYDKIKAGARVVEFKDSIGNCGSAHISADGEITLLEAATIFMSNQRSSITLTDTPVTKANEPKWKIPGPPTKERHGYR